MDLNTLIIVNKFNFFLSDKPFESRVHFKSWSFPGIYKIDANFQTSKNA